MVGRVVGKQLGFVVGADDGLAVGFMEGQIVEGRLVGSTDGSLVG